MFFKGYIIILITSIFFSSFNNFDEGEQKNENNLNFTISLKSISWYNTKKFIVNSQTNFEKDNDNFNIPYNNAFVNIKFEIDNLNFDRKLVRLKYKIIELDKEWKILNNNNQISFIHFPNGAYSLKVMAISKDGKSNSNVLNIPISVKQIYYYQFWFISLLVILFGVLLYLIRKYELTHIYKLEELRLRISRDLHDELGSSLTGIAIKSELLLENINLKSKNIISNEISELSRNAVDSLSDIVWAIDPQKNNIQNLSQRIESLLHQHLTPINIPFNFQTLKFNQSLELPQNIRQHVFLIFKEALTNIMKHSNATTVFVSITKHKKNLTLIVKDNGTKIPNIELCKKGNGIKNMKIRADKINGIIDFYYENGCVVKLTFKYENN